MTCSSWCSRSPIGRFEGVSKHLIKGFGWKASVAGAGMKRPAPATHAMSVGVGAPA